MKYYECWVGTKKHYCPNIPKDADDLTPLRINCRCIGSVTQCPLWKPGMSIWDLRIQNWHPPQVVSVGELKEDDS